MFIIMHYDAVPVVVIAAACFVVTLQLRSCLYSCRHDSSIVIAIVVIEFSRDTCSQVIPGKLLRYSRW